MITEIKTFYTDNEPPTLEDIESAKKIAETDKCLCKIFFRMFGSNYTLEVTKDTDCKKLYENTAHRTWPV